MEKSFVSTFSSPYHEPPIITRKKPQRRCKSVGANVRSGFYVVPTSYAEFGECDISFFFVNFKFFLFSFLWMNSDHISFFYWTRLFDFMGSIQQDIQSHLMACKNICFLLSHFSASQFWKEKKFNKCLITDCFCAKKAMALHTEGNILVFINDCWLCWNYLLWYSFIFL